MTPGRRLGAVRRLAADLRRPETRAGAVQRVRRRIGRLVGGASVPPRMVAAAPRNASRHTGNLAEAIARGEAIEPSIVATVRALAATDDWFDWNAAWSLAQGIRGWPGGGVAADLAEGILLHRRRQLDRAWTRFAVLDDGVLGAHARIEAVDGALAAGSAEGMARAVAIARAQPGPTAAEAIDLAGRFAIVGDRETAAELLGSLSHAPAEASLDPRRADVRRLLEAWLDPAPPVDASEIAIGVMRFRSPDAARPPDNLGDEIQSLAALGHLARHAGVRFSGDEGLVTLATELQRRTPARLRLEGRGTVRLVPVDRDASSLDQPPAGTWLVAFGPQARSLFGLRRDFPYDPSIRPLFVSVHIADADFLDDRAVTYLRRHGPIGCRDWSTVFLLLSAGIDAFFSGCVSVTVDGLIPEPAAEGGRATGLIDVTEVPPGAARPRSYSQALEPAGGTVADGLRAADARLAAYRSELGRAVTTRLTTYLALNGLGIPTELQTRQPGDPRLAGLSGLAPDHPRLVTMRDDLRALLAATFEDILGGAEEAAVYTRWRERTAERVAAARARYEAPIADPETTTDVRELAGSILAGSRRFGPDGDGPVVADVALSYDQNLTLPAAVLIESLVANASGPVRVWILARGLSTAYQEWLGRAFPTVPITFLPCDAVGYGPDGRPRRVPRRITVSTMDRLFLPDLLPDVQRVVYVDVDTLFTDDVARLASTELGSHGLAATDSDVSESSEWDRAGRRLSEELALELRRSMARRHGFGHRALNAGVLVLDLDRLRADGFTRTALARIDRYGLHDQDILLAHVGPDRAVLDPRWNAMPRLVDIADPGLLHWASFPKPWDPELTTAQDRWLEHAERLVARAGRPPA